MSCQLYVWCEVIMTLSGRLVCEAVFFLFRGLWWYGGIIRAARVSKHFWFRGCSWWYCIIRAWPSVKTFFGFRVMLRCDLGLACQQLFVSEWSRHHPGLSVKARLFFEMAISSGLLACRQTFLFWLFGWEFRSGRSCSHFDVSEWWRCHPGLPVNEFLFLRRWHQRVHKPYEFLSRFFFSSGGRVALNKACCYWPLLSILRIEVLPCMDIWIILRGEPNASFFFLTAFLILLSFWFLCWYMTSYAFRQLDHAAQHTGGDVPRLFYWQRTAACYRCVCYRWAYRRCVYCRWASNRSVYIPWALVPMCVTFNLISFNAFFLAHRRWVYNRWVYSRSLGFPCRCAYNYHSLYSFNMYKMRFKRLADWRRRETTAKR